MKLDTKALRYLTPEDWRVLTSVEQGSRNHEIVPTPLIIQISKLRGGSGVTKSISTLAKANLIGRIKNASYDGYRLTYGGLDYLSLHTHVKSCTLYSVGNQVGVGKESDIFLVASPSGTQQILKIHRLGRISFRTVKANRDYLRNRSTKSWMYMSRLAALKEFTFMKTLKQNGFEVPTPIAQNRHTIVMELIDAFPLRQIKEVPDPAGLYAELIEMILRLGSFGLIHGDFNEFNILIKEIDGGKKLVPVLIDFPQMISTSHVNASMYFDRDVKCIKDFFFRRFGFSSDAAGPFFEDAKLRMKGVTKRLDVEAEASGFSKKMSKELESYMKDVGVDGDRKVETNEDEDEDEDEEEGDDLEEEDLEEDRARHAEDAVI